MTDIDKVIRADGAVSLDGAENAAVYDNWAQDYDAQLAGWGYEAPAHGARLLAGHLDRFYRGRLFDCGCGTGLTGKALRDAGARGELIGFDASAASLEVARAKGVYDRLEEADLNAALALDDDSIDGVLCCGVLTYIEAEPLFREWIRVTRPGGVLVFTSRNDLHFQRDYPGIFDRLQDERAWVRVHLSEAMPYLPGNPEFGDQIKVFYGVFRVV